METIRRRERNIMTETAQSSRLLNSYKRKDSLSVSLHSSKHSVFLGARFRNNMNGSIGNFSNTTWQNTTDFQRERNTHNQIVFRSVIAAIAMLVNVLVPAVIGFSRQLHYPRHIIWIAISIANQLIVTGQFIQMISIVDYFRIACRISTLFAGAHYSVLLLFLTLAALDRYLAVSHYEWYKSKATNRRTVFVLLSTALLTYLVITSPFWTRTRTVSACTVNITHMHWILVYDCVLGVICVTLYVMTFVRSRQVIRQHQSAFHQKSITLRFTQNSFKDSCVDFGKLLLFRIQHGTENCPNQ